MDFKVLIREHSNFILRLFQQTALDDQEQQNGTPQNAAMSPISISITLGIAAAGSKGATLDQIVSCMHLPNPSTLHDFAAQVRALVLADASPNGGPLIAFVNGIWVEQTLPLKASFKDAVNNQYGAVAQPADFLNQAEKTRLEINSWVKETTKDVIEEILPVQSLNANSRLVLANALYFKGTWQKQFNATDTLEGEFFLLNGETIRAPMMTTAKKQEITTHDLFKILRLPYSKGEDGRSFSLYIVLPNERNGLVKLETTLDTEFLEQKLVKRNEVPVRSFKLPKFKVCGGYEVPKVLSKLGMELPFSSQADFSDMVDSPVGQSLSIDKIYHKAVVEVNEEGTEAAAATAAVVMLRSFMPTPPEDFVADHPFLFILKEDTTGIIVFLGHVVNPITT